MKMRLMKMAVLAVVAVLTVAGTSKTCCPTDKHTCDVDTEEWKHSYKAADLLLVRPLGLVMTLAGSALWVVTLPVTMASGDSDEAADVLVRKPAIAAFGRR
jgi:hypothetical protein